MRFPALFPLLALALTRAPSAAEPPDPNVRAYSDTIAAQTCARRGFAYFLRLVPGRPEVLCLDTTIGAPNAVNVRELLSMPLKGVFAR
jgi:hypothetical protein